MISLLELRLACICLIVLCACHDQGWSTTPYWRNMLQNVVVRQVVRILHVSNINRGRMPNDVRVSERV